MTRVALLALLASTVPAVAQGVCMPGTALNDQLRAKYGETPVMTGINSAGVPFIMTANAETGTWTLIMVSPEASCVAMTGKDVEIISRKPDQRT